MLEPTLDRIENHLKQIIEASASRSLARGDLTGFLTHHLSTALLSELAQDDLGRPVAPEGFTVWLHPSLASELRNNPQWIDQSARTVTDLAREAGLAVNKLPTITILEDQSLSPSEGRVQAIQHLDRLEETKAFQIAPTDEANDLPADAFLIVGGAQIFPITRGVTNIGRRLDNHLVIDDPRVSRLHVQLRVTNGQFVLFDLGSKGGTFVNDHRISECHIFPGDVISLAGAVLVFGQEEPQSPEDALGQTRPLLPRDEPDTSPSDPHPG